MALVDVELSEPYSVFTYRYFINNWQRLCFLVRPACARSRDRALTAAQAFIGERCVGAVVCKLDTHRGTRRGYLAMLVVEKEYRKLRIGAYWLAST
jgi:peptide alpha-N-acetyltransferase